MTTTASDVAGRKGRRVTPTPEPDDLDSRVEGSLPRSGDEGLEDAILVWNGMVARATARINRNIRPRA
jgi:hypothetical protein